MKYILPITCLIMFLSLAQRSQEYVASKEHGYSKAAIDQVAQLSDEDSENWLAQLEVNLYTKEGKKL